jgi:uncharacterized protein (TIRG00374 family)
VALAPASAHAAEIEHAEVSNEPAVAADTPVPANDPGPVTGDASAHRLRRGVIRLGAIIAVAVIIVTLVPGLGDLRERFAHARPIWIAIACALEVLSVLAYVPAFRAVFCRRMAWSTSYKIAVAEEGAGSLFPLGGAGSLALGVWALRRGGMHAAEIARKTVAFFLLTSLFPVGILLLLGIGLATRVLPGGGPIALTALSAAVAAAAIVATIALGRFARRAEIRIRHRNPDSRLARVAPALLATADGVDDALHELRRLDPLLLLGLFGFLVFDILAFWASFRAVGLSPAPPVVAIGYLIGQLGSWLPIPGGIGGTELGLVGVLILFGLPAVPVTAAVLLYRVIELWIPALLGLTAFVQLRVLLRRETEPIQLCDPGGDLEVVALDVTTIGARKVAG